MLSQRVRFLNFYRQIVFHCVNVPQLFIHSSTDGNLGCFQILTIVNNAAMDIGVLRFFWINVLGSFVYIPRSGIAGSKGKTIFNFSRYLYTAFHSSYINLYSQQQHNSVPHSPQSSQLFFVDLLVIVILAGVRYFIVVLICLSLMISDFEHLFICVLANCMVSLRKCLFRFSGTLPIFKLFFLFVCSFVCCWVL